MDSVSKQQSAPSLLFCPFAKFENKENEFRWMHFGEPPMISHAEYDKSSSHNRPLDWSNNKEGTCGACTNRIVGTPFYSCKECIIKFSGELFLGNHMSLSSSSSHILPLYDSISNFRNPFKLYNFAASKFVGYHKECIEPISKHPYHPKHSLRLSQNSWSKICLCCLRSRDLVYSCCICDFTMCQDCARKPSLLEIYHPKRHEHTLFYIPRKSSFNCDVCALSDHMSLIYSCRQCDFVVHKECVYFPFIIRISRHEHRLSFKSSLTPEKLLCGVCQGRVDTNYGRYSCIKDCRYGVHSKCATREDVWDGKELEKTPEDAYEDIKPFIKISDGIIQHFSHQNHHMRLDEEINRVFDENKRCQACTLPNSDDIIYNCTQCEFILHQQCAHLPRKKQHATHPHPLRLEADHHDSCFKCSACKRVSNGFVYLCSAKDCKFILDVFCASIAEPLEHRCHPHSLFLTSKPKTQQICSICHESQGHCLNCGECSFVLCFGCATLPGKLRYKHEEHFLILSYDDKDGSGQYFCEICEKEADPKNGIYMCNDHNVTLHIKCLLGVDMYIMSGGIVKLYETYINPGHVLGRLEMDVNILPNNRLTRNKCTRCHNRCTEKVVYKISDRMILCSYDCVKMYWTYNVSRKQNYYRLL